VLPDSVYGCLNVCDNTAALMRIENTLFAVRHVVDLDVYVFHAAGINLFSRLLSVHKDINDFASASLTICHKIHFLKNVLSMTNYFYTITGP
jgi:hypothetical protein